MWYTFLTTSQKVGKTHSPGRMRLSGQKNLGFLNEYLKKLT